MSRIARLFSPPGHKALIAYLTIGYPKEKATMELVPFLAEAGCDLVELGIPFSDPMVDGATIQKASQKALEQGTTPQRCLEVAHQLRKTVEIPLVFMTYYNPLLNLGLEAFCHAAGGAIDGLIIPDLPPEEAGELEAAASRYSMDLIFLLAPNSSEDRVSLVASRSRGFIYLVSLTGVTGAREALPRDLEAFVARVRAKTDKPLCVGFGIANREQALRAARLADGVIVGSRLLDLLDTKGDPRPSMASFIRDLRQALDG